MTRSQISSREITWLPGISLAAEGRFQFMVRKEKSANREV